MGDDSSLPEPFARRLARVDIPVLTSGRGRETSPGRSLYGWAKFRLRTFSKNPPNSRTKGAECEAQRTQQAYLKAVERLAIHYGKRPDLLSSRDIQRFVLHLHEVDGLSWSTCNTVVNG